MRMSKYKTLNVACPVLFLNCHMHYIGTRETANYIKMLVVAFSEL